MHVPEPPAKPVLFVTGVMRSGTTLLHRILVRSCGCDYVPEVDSLHVMVESFQVLEQYQAFRPLGREGYVALYRQLLAATLNACARAMAGGTMVLKDPMALKTLALFHELSPTTRFVVSVRNPLATVASILRVRDRQRAQGRSSFITMMEFGDVVEYVAGLGEIILALRGRPNLLAIRYEDLVMRDAVAVAALAAFAGTGIDMELDDESGSYDPAHPFWTAQSGGRIAVDALDKYTRELDAARQAVVAGRLAAFNAAFGYG
jgi:hypothetical protein